MDCQHKFLISGHEKLKERNCTKKLKIQHILLRYMGHSLTSPMARGLKVEDWDILL